MDSRVVAAKEYFVSKLRICSIADCGRKHYGRGLCQRHYLRVRRRGVTELLTRHNLSKSPEYTAWYDMNRRCYDKQDINFKRYGGRGITVFKGWISPRYGGAVNNFLNFFKYLKRTIGLRPPSPKQWKGKRSYWSLDRKNNDRGYQPGNLRWSGYEQQARAFRSGFRELSAANVREIRRRNSAGESRRSIGRKFSVTHHVIGRIVRGKTFIGGHQ